MKKTIAIIGANLLIAGGLSARASWMIISGCNIDGTCRGSSDLLTWGLAVGPALVLLVVIGLSLPKLFAGMAERREERREMKAEKAAVATAFAEEAEQGQNRLARLKRPVEEPQDSGYAADDDFMADAPLIADQDDQLPAVDDFGFHAEAGAYDAAPAAPAQWEPAAIADEDADAIEREWLAAEAELQASRDSHPLIADAAGTIEGHGIAHASPVFDAGDAVPMMDADATPDWPAADIWQAQPVAADQPAAVTDDIFDDAVEQPAITTFDPALLAEDDEPQQWHIESAEDEAALPRTDFTAADESPVARPAVDIWQRTAFDIGSDDDDDAGHDVAANGVALSRLDSLAIEATDTDLPPLDMPVIGQAPDEWAWLFADGLPLLRTSRATGFPWIAGGIGEVASAVQTAVDLDHVGNFGAEAEAWVRIARSIPYAEALPAEDAQAFVDWCNALSVDLSASNQQDALCQAISEAMYALRGRARNDMETSLALPDPFDTSFPGAGAVRSLSA